MGDGETISDQQPMGIDPSVGSKDGVTTAANNAERDVDLSASSDLGDKALAATKKNMDGYPPQEPPTPMEHDTSSLANELLGGTQVADHHEPDNGLNNGELIDNVSAGVSEIGISTAGVNGSAGYQDSALSAEEERLWSIVHTNSSDFNAWTALIEETEKMSEGNISKIQKVYDAFLAEFPLCYGYWKKYADHEAHLGSVEKVMEVYERAVSGVTYSVDMWLHYYTFAISIYGGDPDTVRRLFERGLAYVGSDYLSFPLWDKYIGYEYTQQDWPRVAMLYTRVLENPNQQLDRYFEGLSSFTKDA